MGLESSLTDAGVGPLALPVMPGVLWGLSVDRHSSCSSDLHPPCLVLLYSTLLGFSLFTSAPHGDGSVIQLMPLALQFF
jgi:hypothetical protein